uniref:15-cis-zeta-carotene isomerase, chloroplastic n=1 Tax=Lygus hesperus TaxID=30085 RepID=A0A0A9XRD4_LYGHE
MFKKAFQKFATLPYGVKVASAGWLAFSATHLTLSHPPVREKMIDFCGNQTNFRIIYGTIATAIAGTTVLLYSRTPPSLRGKIVHNLYRRRNDTQSSSIGFRASVLLQAVGAFFVTDSYVTAYRNPLAMTDSEPKDPRSIRRMYQIAGLQRITRHHEFFGYVFFALGSMLANNRVGDMILYGFIPVFTAAGIIHQEYRLRQTKPAFYFEDTSIIPFQAVLEGKQSLTKALFEVSPASYAATFCVISMMFFWP